MTPRGALAWSTFGLRSATLCAGFLLAVGCRPRIAEPPEAERIEVEHVAEQVRFAVIGDYGKAGPAEAAVSRLVHGWEPELIITLGDNNYENGSADTIDDNIGQYYHDYIHPYRGKYGPGSDTPRFFPSLGNHDWRSWTLQPYLQYFQLPGNERYYDFSWGPVHFFAVDSGSPEPDGRDARSKQARWLRDALTTSTLPWQLVFMHHAPYSSGRHGSAWTMRWPYHAWGADIVMSGHDHHYERIERDGALFFVNGLGGSPKVYGVGSPVDGSKVRYNDDWGAMLVEATATDMTIQFITIEGEVVDTVRLHQR